MKNFHCKFVFLKCMGPTMGILRLHFTHPNFAQMGTKSNFIVGCPIANIEIQDHPSQLFQPSRQIGGLHALTSWSSVNTTD